MRGVATLSTPPQCFPNNLIEGGALTWAHVHTAAKGGVKSGYTAKGPQIRLVFINTIAEVTLLQS